MRSVAGGGKGLFLLPKLRAGWVFINQICTNSFNKLYILYIYLSSNLNVYIYIQLEIIFFHYMVQKKWFRK